MKLAYILSFIVAVNAALLGIDFGTAYTKAILVAPGVNYDLLLTPESKRKSVAGLAITNEGDDIIRHFDTQAQAMCVRRPESCIMGVKSALDEEGKVNVEIAAMLFSELKRRAELHWKETSELAGSVEDAVISVPAHWNAITRSSIVDAASVAGLNVIGLVNEGLAVGIDYAQRKGNNAEELIPEEYHLVFDCGAGETKASLIWMHNNVSSTSVELVNIANTELVSGNEFTLVVRDMILDILPESARDDARVMNRVWMSAERAKIVLSANNEARVSLEYQDVDYNTVLLREEFENRVGKKVNESIEIMLDEVLNGFEGELSSVQIVGGSVRVPLVQTKLSEYFGNIVSKHVNADESCVFGTTYYGAYLLGITRKRTVDIIPSSIHQYKFQYNAGNVTEMYMEPFEMEHVDEIFVNIIENDQIIQNVTVTVPTFNNTAVFGMEFDLDPIGTVKIVSMKMNETSLPMKSTRLGMSASEKSTISRKLRAMDTGDVMRETLAEAKNQLEAALYALRELGDEEFVSEQLEWLEYEEPTLEEVYIKREVVNKKIDSYLPHVVEEVVEEVVDDVKKTVDKEEEVPEETPSHDEL